MHTASRLLGSSLLALCLGTGCAAVKPRPPQRGAFAGVGLAVMPVAARGASPLSLFVVIDNGSGPEVALDPADFSLGPARGSACSPVTVEAVAAAAPPQAAGRALYAQAGRAQVLAAEPSSPSAGTSSSALLDLEVGLEPGLAPGTLGAPGRSAGILTFPCEGRGFARPLVLRWRLREAATGAALGEIAVPVLP